MPPRRSDPIRLRNQLTASLVAVALVAPIAASGASQAQRQAFAQRVATLAADCQVREPVAEQVPVDLIVAVAALETGWGTSRFAREAHNLFGIRCNRPGCGLRPAQAKRDNVYVRKFASDKESVCTFVELLNSDPRYQRFRELRAQALAEGRAPDAYALAAGLEPWSELGPEYVRRVRLVLRGVRRLQQ
ncbi:MAG: hypothetical protein D6761_12885 [Candidatus Dadabacteria bacterium]|nr:MAG: hypothetical protein D6761_12885 [Candidatus Dadabacteria bacterium]